MKVRPSEATLPASTDRFRTMVEGELDGFLAAVRGDLSAVSREALTLLDEILRLVEAGGKRIRPLFCFWGYRAAGGVLGTEIARAGAAIELLHTCAIIHDDVLDGSERRRGEPASHRALMHGGPDPERFGRAAAVLAGDLAHVLADRMLVESGFPAPAVLAAFGSFNRMRMEAVGGEFLDLLTTRGAAPTTVPPPSEADSRRIASLKSGSYTVVGPLQMGATLAGAGPGLLDALARYARPLGEAFQLRDDVLGAFGDPSVTGKDCDSDLREGKMTTLVAKLWRMGSERERRLVERRLGRHDVTPQEIEELRAGMRGSGALSEALGLIRALAARATGTLEGVPLTAEVRDALVVLADAASLRDA